MRVLRWGTGSVLAAATLAAGACLEPRHPLADGDLAFLVDQGLLFAADQLDENGVPVLPRQQPFEKGVQLYLTRLGAPDVGAYVDLKVTPPGALTLVTVDDTCEVLPGVFRCTAGADGFANLRVRSDSNYSGVVTVSTVVKAQLQTQITVSRPGVPDGSSIALVIEGASGNRVRADFDALDCSLTASSETLDKWPAGSIRSREVYVQSTIPTNAADSLANAPVLVDTPSPEAFVSTDPTCPEPHNRSLRVLLDGSGRSPTFHLCMSDLGGNAELTARSGSATATPLKLVVDPEPRLLRVKTVKTDFNVSEGSSPTLQVSAFDADLKPVALDVEVESNDETALQLDVITFKLNSNDSTPTSVSARPVGPGEARLVVKPLLFTEPYCESELITVQ